ncbi:MAG: Nramp family divalent metal transporter [Nitrososphaeria archaeon]|nr:Nramp family divalent metal transporter [Nitrososphaeria archaeon]MDW8043358.1 Nramp family divalent metal transporter [Nitrososphaerota archaeon]
MTAAKPSEVIELPEPPRPGLWSYLRAVGPGVIMTSLAIGAGEWILFPAAVVRFGPYLMWAAAFSCVLQAVLAVESMKTVVYCGQPVHKFYQRLWPGGLAWAWVWAVLLFIPVMWPAWAISSATAAVALQLGTIPGPAHSSLVLTWGVIAMVVGLGVLHVGRKIERTLELLSWPIVILMLVTISAAVVIAAPTSAWIEVGKGIFTVNLPRNVDWFVLAAAIAYIPAGFGFNLMMSSYARDKGWGMGARAGYIPAIIGGRNMKISTDDMPFTITPENLRRWKGWLNVLRVDSWIVFSLVSFVTVYVTTTMAYTLLVPKGLTPTGFAVAAAQAEALKAVAGELAWVIVLLGGFWILFDTQWGLMDSVSRVIADNFWTASEKVRRLFGHDIRRLYYTVLYLIFGVSMALMVGAVALRWAQPFELVALGANLGLFALTIAFPLQIIVNYKFLPKEIRGGPVTTLLLAAGTFFYGYFLVAVLLQTLFGIRL